MATAAENTVRLAVAADKIELARHYLLDVLKDIDDADYLKKPEGVTHVAWQLGHIATAQYGLTMFRVRGARPEDAEFIPPEFMKKYGRGSVPGDDNPPPAELREIAARVHEQAVRAVREYPVDDLERKLDPPHPVFNTPLQAFEFCSMHEMLHVGEIAVLRRQLGREPLR